MIAIKMSLYICTTFSFANDDNFLQDGLVG